MGSHGACRRDLARPWRSCRTHSPTSPAHRGPRIPGGDAPAHRHCDQPRVRGGHPGAARSHCWLWSGREDLKLRVPHPRSCFQNGSRSPSAARRESLAWPVVLLVCRERPGVAQPFHRQVPRRDGRTRFRSCRVLLPPGPAAIERPHGFRSLDLRDTDSPDIRSLAWVARGIGWERRSRVDQCKLRVRLRAPKPQ